jgi:hypothetical protein
MHDFFISWLSRVTITSYIPSYGGQPEVRAHLHSDYLFRASHFKKYFAFKTVLCNLIVKTDTGRDERKHNRSMQK